MTSTFKCLLIDDDSDDQQIFLGAVHEVSPTTRCSVISDAETALEILKDSVVLPDIIFLDINMPRMDGFEMIIQLKRDPRLAKIPVIFYSTTSDERQIAQATKLGATGFVTKTPDYSTLCKILAHFLNGKPADKFETFVLRD
jgi:CheY-like chemotaxis protein